MINRRHFLSGLAAAAAFPSIAFGQSVANVLDFGAVGDGVADDTPAINAAIATGKTVLLEAGNYKNTSALTPLAAGQGIIGDGMGRSALLVSGSGYDAVSLANDYSFIEDIYITSPSPMTSGKAIKLPSATRGNGVRRCKFNNQFRGVSIDGNAVITYLEDLEVVNTTPTTGIAIDIKGGNDTFLNRIVADNPTGSQPAAGLRVANSQAIWATDCDFIRCGNGLLINPTSSVTTWLFFTTCAFDSGSKSGANICPSGTAIVRGLFFNGCWYSTNAERGFIVQPSGSASIDGVYLEQPKILNNGLQGFLSLAGPKNVHLSNPVVSGNSASASGIHSGIDFQPGASEFSIQGGRSGATMGFANTQSRGILINPGASNNYTILGVDVRGNVNAGIYDGGTGANKHLSGNLGFP